MAIETIVDRFFVQLVNWSDFYKVSPATLAALVYTETEGKPKYCVAEPSTKDYRMGLCGTTTWWAHFHSRREEYLATITWPTVPEGGDLPTWRRAMDPETSISITAARLSWVDRVHDLRGDPLLQYAACSVGKLLRDPGSPWGIAARSPSALDTFAQAYGDAVYILSSHRLPYFDIKV